MEARSVSTRSYPIFLACKCVSKPHRRQPNGSFTTLTAVTGVPSSLRSPQSPKPLLSTILIMRRTSTASSSYR